MAGSSDRPEAEDSSDKAQADDTQGPPDASSDEVEAVAAPDARERGFGGAEAGEASASAKYGIPLTQSRGQDVLHPSRDELIALAEALRDEHGFAMCVDVTAVDYLVHEAPRDLPEGVEPQRYELVINVLSHAKRERLRLRVQVPEDDPTVPSLFDVYPGSEALEREVYDMFGIRFEGHPDPTRILMPEDWEGHPLRKQYPVGTIPVQFKGVTNVR